MISKRSQLVLSVIIFLIVIIFLWVYLNSKTNLLNFGLGQETQNFGKNISTQIKDLNFRKDFNTKVNEFANPNQYISKKTAINGEMKSFLMKTSGEI